MNWGVCVCERRSVSREEVRGERRSVYIGPLTTWALGLKQKSVVPLSLTLDNMRDPHSFV